ncbi:MAG: preprotein translocase subunit SecE [Zetaproteobacteria bacterium]|nr:preprotein translocase subunit SecE [Zetaproteobacteria bacterium]
MQKDDATWLNYCYIAFAVLVAYVCHKVTEMIGEQFGWVDVYDWYPIVNSMCSLVLGAGSALWLRSDPERREYHLSAIAEVQKVAWPSYPDTKKMTSIVVVFVAIFSVILTAFDLVWSKVLQFLFV